MCTAIRFNERYFGRTFDFERSFGESLVITPREKMRILESHNRYAMMGIGVLCFDIPMYFDGVNEWGLVAAALNFPKYTVYHQPEKGGTGVPSGHLISHILGLCRSVSEVREMLKKITITGDPAGDRGTSPLHWIVCDRRETIVVESVAGGTRIYDNLLGVLTNSPEFSYHMTRIQAFLSLKTKNPEPGLYSRGMGAIGLPGDFSSPSRFIRAAFLKQYVFGNMAIDNPTELSRAFSVLSSVAIPVGAVISDEGLPVFTIYTAILDLENLTYYLTTSSCRSIIAISMKDSLLDGMGIRRFPIYRDENIISLAE
jgi:choloylglycine hydrolase